MSSKLDWYGKAVKELLKQAALEALDEYGARVEGQAKRPLTFGHGVLTGTYRRSLHAANPDYRFEADDVAPSSGTPERAGGSNNTAEVKPLLLQIDIGSGLKYAIYVEARYGTIKDAHTANYGNLQKLLQKKAKAKGLR